VPHLSPKVATLALVVGWGALGATPPRTFTLWPQPAPAQPATTPELLELGAKVYRGACIQCHGEKGNGQGKEAKNLAIPPRDFTTGTFLIRSTPLGSLPLDTDLFGSVRRGFRPDVGMPSFTFLSDHEVWAVVAYVKTFSSRWKTEGAQEALDAPPPPANLAGLAPLGQVTFMSIGACFVCHGMQGQGDGPAAAGTAYTVGSHAGERVPPANLSKSKNFKGGNRPRDLYRSISTGLDGTPMPSFGHLTPEQRWQLVSFVLSLNKP
jgi:mono/diheme cytochrome c family protein